MGLISLALARSTRPSTTTTTFSNKALSHALPRKSYLKGSAAFYSSLLKGSRANITALYKGEPAHQGCQLPAQGSKCNCTREFSSMGPVLAKKGSGKGKGKGKAASLNTSDNLLEYYDPQEASNSGDKKSYSTVVSESHVFGEPLITDLKAKNGSQDIGKKKSNSEQLDSPLKAKVKEPKEKYNTLTASKFQFKAHRGLQLKDVPTIKFGLDRCLFNPGVTYLQDPRTSIYNFDPYLQNIVDVAQFDFNKIVGYIPAGKDHKLINMARANKKKFVSTTSSTTHLLCHLYFLISHWRTFDTSFLSAPFQRFSTQFSKTLTFPPSVVIRKHEGGVYSINADKSFDNETTVLSQLGQVMERMLTMSPKEFSKYLIKPCPEGEAAQEEKVEPEACTYNYSLTKNMVLRAQLDCVDRRLPNKIYDLKTRACLPVRLDQGNFKDYLSYNVKTLHGVHESYEREYYDLMRSAFLKYSFQVRIGQMDGCLVAYHNTETIFGFQYVSLAEMDSRLFGNSVMGDQAFANSTQLLENILNEVTTKYPEDELMLTLKTTEDSLTLQVYVEIINKDRKVVENTVEEAIYSVDPLSRLAKFQVMVYSTVNGEKLTKPLQLVDIPGLDEWKVNYTLKEVKINPLDLYKEYVTLRHIQSTFYDYDREGMSILQRVRSMTTFNKNNPQPPKPKPVVYRPSSY